RLSVPPLVEVMRGKSVILDCTPTGTHDHYMLEWFLTDRSGARPRLASAEMQGSELQVTMHDTRGRSPPYQLDSQGRLVLAEAQVGDERDYVCVVRAGAAGTAEATARLNVFAKPEATEVSPNKGTLSVMEDSAQEVLSGGPWSQEGYMTSRTVREASGLLSLTSTLYLRLHKDDRDASFHCAAHYSLPEGRHGRLDSPTFHLTLHYPTEHVQFWVGSPSTPAGWVREGDTVQLLCRGDGSPSPEYTLFRLQDEQEEVLNVNLEGNLTLEGVTRGQSGTYGCRVEDYDAADDVQLSKTLELRVAYLDPLELSEGKVLSLPLNSSAVVNCSVHGLPTPALRWTKVRGKGAPSVLSPFDSNGPPAHSPGLSRTQNFTLLVQGSPELRTAEIEPKADGSWREGDEVTLICSARGHPEPKLSWSQLGGSPAEPIPGRQGWVSSSLTLKVTSALSRDGISCEASNPHGNKRHVFHFGTVSPQTSQAGVAVMAVAVSFLPLPCAPPTLRLRPLPPPPRPPGEPELSHSGSEQPEQTGLLMGGASGGARGGSGGFRDEVGEGLGPLVRGTCWAVEHAHGHRLTSPSAPQC
uniref:Basal cell adhesion molecule n=1 Tax=Nomascus leucogenys TaxID=61853 RepID=A0A2I3HZR6_NOMLE